MIIKGKKVKLVQTMNDKNRYPVNGGNTDLYSSGLLLYSKPRLQKVDDFVCLEN